MIKHIFLALMVLSASLISSCADKVGAQTSVTVSIDTLDKYMQSLSPGEYNIKVLGKIVLTSIDDIIFGAKIDDIIRSTPQVLVHLDLSGIDIDYFQAPWFEHCENLLSIKLSPKKHDLWMRFDGCKDLNLLIPDNIRMIIGCGALADCKGIKIEHPKNWIGGKDYGKVFEPIPELSTEILCDTTFTSFLCADFLYSEDGTELIWAGSASGDVIIPDNVKSIRDEAFCYTLSKAIAMLPSVRSIQLPKSLEKLSALSLPNDSGLVITVPKGNKNFVVEDGILYSKDKTVIYDARNAKGNFVVPEGVKEIGKYAFYYNQTIKSVKLPSTLKVIDTLAFANTDISSIDFPESLERICYQAFSNITHDLGEIKLPKNLRCLEQEVFGRGGHRTQKASLPSNITKIVCEEYQDDDGELSPITSYEIPSTYYYSNKVKYANLPDGEWFVALNIQDWENRVNGIPLSSLKIDEEIEREVWKDFKDDGRQPIPTNEYIINDGLPICVWKGNEIIWKIKDYEKLLESYDKINDGIMLGERGGQQVRVQYIRPYLYRK